MTVRFDVNEEYYQRLLQMAEGEHLDLQAYIRWRLFGGEKPIFTVDELIRRIRARGPSPEPFSVPDLFSEAEWATINKGQAGVLGREFWRRIAQEPELGIRWLPEQTINRRTVYIYEDEEGVQ